MLLDFAHLLCGGEFFAYQLNNVEMELQQSCTLLISILNQLLQHAADNGVFSGGGCKSLGSQSLFNSAQALLSSSNAQRLEGEGRLSCLFNHYLAAQCRYWCELTSSVIYKSSRIRHFIFSLLILLGSCIANFCECFLGS